MADWGNIIPHIGEIYPERIDKMPMPSVVLHISAAMPTQLNRRADVAESVVLALAEIEQAVMRRIEPPLDRQAEFDIDHDPIAKVHPLFQEEVRKEDIPLRDVVEEEGAAGFQNTDALFNPAVAPLNIFRFGPPIVNAGPVFLADVKGGVGENGIDDSVGEALEELDTIPFEQSSSRRGVFWEEFAVPAEW